MLDVPDRLSELGGVTGLAASGPYIFAMTSRSRAVGRASRESPGPSVLLVFDRKSFSLANEYTCSSVFDAHSLLAEEGGLYVVSTGTDAVVRLSLDGVEVVSEEVYWRPDPAGPPSDGHHINGLCRSGGALLVSGLGPRSGRHWSSAEDGFVIDVRTGRRIATGIFHPHSLAEVEGGLAWCESSRMSVHVLGTGRTQRLPGYSRGLCRVGSQVFVATSRGRRVSKSTGLLTMTGDSGDPLEGRCALARLAADTLAIERVFDLEAYGWEVYDLLPVEDVSEWPTAADLRYAGSGRASASATAPSPGYMPKSPSATG